MTDNIETTSTAPVNSSAPVSSSTENNTPAPAPQSIQEASKSFLSTEGKEATWDDVTQRFRASNGEFTSNSNSEEQVALDGEVDPSNISVVEGENETEILDEVDELQSEEQLEEEVQAAKFVLPGDPQRGEEEIEIEVTDPAVAERLARLKNDGLRASEFKKRMEGVSSRETQLRVVESEMATNPVGFMIDRMPPARQIEVARALMVQHFDSLMPDIEKFWNDDSERKVALADIRTSAIEARREAEAQTQHQHQVSQVIAAVQELIPESANESDIEEFLRDSFLHLEALSREKNGLVNPSEVPTLLASRLTRYGFSQRAVASENGNNEVKEQPSPSKQTIAIARPAGDNAKAVADRAKAAQQRQKAIRIQRANAAAVAPAGAGAMPVETPKPPKGADVKAASAWARERISSNNWGKTS